VPSVPDQERLMVGLGETDEEILQVMRDLREAGVEMLTIGQYLLPAHTICRAARYVTPENLRRVRGEARALGFGASGLRPAGAKRRTTRDLQAQAAVTPTRTSINRNTRPQV